MEKSDDKETQPLTNLHVISHISLVENKDNEKIKFNYKPITKLSSYNTLRFKTIEILDEQFIQPVMEKGIKNERQKILLQNNSSEFRQFIEQKLRYWLSELFQKNEFKNLLHAYNEELFSEIESNAKMITVTADVSKRNLLLKTINDHIVTSNQSILSKKIASYLLLKNDYKEVILGFFNEFLKYLVIF